MPYHVAKRFGTLAMTRRVDRWGRFLLLAIGIAAIVLSIDILGTMVAPGSPVRGVPGTPNPIRSDASGTTYYISSSSGNDSADGLSPGTAWASFKRVNANVTRTALYPALVDGTNPAYYENGTPCYVWYYNVTNDSTALKPGDAILLKRGDTWHERLRLKASGNETHPIELGAYGLGGRPRIYSGNTEYGVCITLDDVSWWHVHDIDLREAKVGIYLRYYNDFHNRHVTIENCTFTDIAGARWNVLWEHGFELAWHCGVFVGGRVDNASQYHLPVLDDLTVRDCTFVNCTVSVGMAFYWPDNYRSRFRNVILEDCSSTGGVQGAMLFFVDGGYMRRFHVLDGGGYYSCGVAGGFAQSCQNYIIERCIIANIRRELCPDGVGWDFEGDNRNMTFRNNVIYNCDGAAMLVMSTISTNEDIRIENSLFYNNCRNPTGDDYAYELLCYDEYTTGTISNVRIYKGDDRNRVTGDDGITIDKAGSMPASYHVKYIGQDIAGRSFKWASFDRPCKALQLVYDPSFDYTSLWPIDGCTWCDGSTACGIPAFLTVTNLAFLVAIVLVGGIARSRRRRT